MFNHYDRRQEHIGNENYDPERTHLNYNLAPDRDSQGDFIRQRCAEVRTLNRKDVNVMVSWVLTAPADLPEADRRQFFQTGYDFMAARYGGEKNVVSAYVHMDEVSPHMHFAFVPVVEDKKRGGFKLSAHEVVDRKDLKTFHQDLSRRMEQVFGRDAGILNEATAEGNKSIEELKRGTATKAAQEAQKQIQAAKQEAARVVMEATEKVEDAKKEAGEILLNARQEAGGIVSTARQEAERMSQEANNAKIRAAELQTQLDTLKAEITPLRAEFDARTAYIKKCDRASEVSMAIPKYAVIKKPLFGGEETVTVPRKKWEQKHVSANQKQYLHEATEVFNRSMQENGQTVQGLIQDRKEKKVLERELREVKGQVEGMKMVIRSNPYLQELYEKQGSILQKEKERQKQEGRPLAPPRRSRENDWER